MALPLFRSDPVLVMNGDSYCDAEFGSFWQWHWRHEAVTSLLLTKAEDAQRFGQVQVAENGAVTAFHEKGTSAGSGFVSAGIYLMSRNLIASIPGGTFVSLEREVFPRWVGRGLYGFETESRFMDIGTPDAFAGAGSFFAGLSR